MDFPRTGPGWPEGAPSSPLARQAASRGGAPPVEAASATAAALSPDAPAAVDLDAAIRASLPEVLPPLSAVETGDYASIDDIQRLFPISDRLIAHTLLHRFRRGLVYTRAGSQLLFINPRAPVSMLLAPASGPGSEETRPVEVSIYHPSVMQRYFQRPHTGLLTARSSVGPSSATAAAVAAAAAVAPTPSFPPHVFDVADVAYRSASRDRIPQTLVFLGSAGAGKTENMKQAVRYLASVSRATSVARGLSPATATASAPSLELVVTEGLALLEHFTHAATPTNPNHSRACTRATLFLRPDGVLESARLSCFLFDASPATAAVTAVGRRLPATGTPHPTGPRLFSFLEQLSPFVETAVAGDLTGAIRSLRASTPLGRSMDRCGLTTETIRVLFRVGLAVRILGSLTLRASAHTSQAEVAFAPELNAVAILLGLGDAQALQQLLLVPLSLTGASSSSSASSASSASSVSSAASAATASLESARERRDALTEILYRHLVGTAVRAVNTALHALRLESPTAASVAAPSALPRRRSATATATAIHVLDVPSFENVENEREQLAGLGSLLANLAAERVEASLLASTIDVDARLMEIEGIALPPPPLGAPERNGPVLHVLDGRGTPDGLVRQLDEMPASALPLSSRVSAWLPNLARLARTSRHLRIASTADSSVAAGKSWVVVAHSSGEVAYDPVKLVAANDVALAAAAATLLPRSCRDVTMSAWLSGLGTGALGPASDTSLGVEEPTMAAGAAGAAGAVASVVPGPLSRQFGDWMADVLVDWEESQLATVRCLNGSESLVGGFVEEAHLQRQISAARVAPVVALESTAFPHRMALGEFYERFVPLVPSVLAEHGPRLPRSLRARDVASSDGSVPDGGRELCLQVVRALWDGLPALAYRFPVRESSVQVGRTRVFLTTSCLKMLEVGRRAAMGSMDWASVQIQRVVRGFLARRRARRAREAITRLQALHRMRMERDTFQFFRARGATVKNFVRTQHLHRRFLRWRHAARLIQGTWRRFHACRDLHESRLALLQLHVIARGFLLRERLLAKVHAAHTLQRIARGFIFRHRLRMARRRGAVRLQALWRGYRGRMDHSREVAQLWDLRCRIGRRQTCARLVAASKGLAVRERFLHLRRASVRVQAWVRARLACKRFWREHRAAVRIQALVRGAQTRRALENLASMELAAHEAWSVHLQRVVEWDAMRSFGETMHSHAFWHSGSGSSDMGRPAAGGDLGVAPAAFRVVDVDILHNIQPIYNAASEADAESSLGGPRAWTTRLAQLERDLVSRGSLVRRVALGSSHTVALSADGEVFSWGWGDRGQLGHGRFVSEADARKVGVLSSECTHLPFTPLANPTWMPRTKVIAVAAGADHSLALASTGVVFAWGENSRGQLGLGHTANTSAPTAVTALHRKVAIIGAGAKFSVFLTQAGSVYTAGAGEFCGVGRDPALVLLGNDSVPDLLTPTGVFALTHHTIRDIACGRAHTVALSADGDVFTWGHGDAGQLGLGTFAHRLVPALVNFDEADEAAVGDVGDGAELGVRLFSSPPPKPPPLSVPSVGSLAAQLAEDQARAQAEAEARGLRWTSHTSHVARVAGATAVLPPMPPLSPFSSLSASPRSMGVLRGSSPTSGAGGPTFSSRRSLLVGRIRTIACGARHSLALSERGMVFAWGSNQCGQLGVGDRVDCARPQRVHGPWEESEETGRPEQLAAGWSHSVLLTANRRIFEWGRAGIALEGMIRDEEQATIDPADVESYFRRVETLHPREVGVLGVEGYSCQAIHAAWSPSLSVTCAQFTVGKEPIRIIQAAMERLAHEAAAVYGADGRSSAADHDGIDERGDSGVVEGEGGEEEEDNYEVLGVTEMLRVHPELRKTYASVLVTRQKRRAELQSIRQHGAAAGLREAAIESLVASAIGAPSESERLIDATILFYANRVRRKRLLHRRLRARMLEVTRASELVSAGNASMQGPVHLIVRWRDLTPVERFHALGLSRAHLDVLSTEQLTRLAFALRAQSHVAARSSFAAVSDGAEPAKARSPRSASPSASSPTRAARSGVVASASSRAKDPWTNRAREAGWDSSFGRTVRSPRVPVPGAPGRATAEGTLSRATLVDLGSALLTRDADPGIDRPDGRDSMAELVARTDDPSLSSLVSSSAARLTLEQLAQSDRFRHELIRFQTVALAISHTAKEQLAAASVSETLAELGALSLSADGVPSSVPEVRLAHSRRSPSRGRGAGVSGAARRPRVELVYNGPPPRAAATRASSHLRLQMEPARTLGHRVPSAFGSDTLEFRDYLLPGGRFDRAEEQRAALEARREEVRRQEEKERLAVQAKEDVEEWRASVRGGGASKGRGGIGRLVEGNGRRLLRWKRSAFVHADEGVDGAGAGRAEVRHPLAPALPGSTETPSLATVHLGDSEATPGADPDAAHRHVRWADGVEAR